MYRSFTYKNIRHRYRSPLEMKPRQKEIEREMCVCVSVMIPNRACCEILFFERIGVMTFAVHHSIGRLHWIKRSNCVHEKN